MIPTHDRSGTLRTTLHRLLDSPPQGTWEIVVVANACTDDTVIVVEEEIARDTSVPLSVIQDARPSASVARNLGARSAAGSLLVFLDDDILLEPGALATISSWYAGSDGRSLLVGQVVPMAEHLATPFGSFRQRALGDVPRDREPHAVDWFASGLAAVPAATFQELGGYAENYPAAALEDADFGIRVRRTGHAIVFHPAVVGLHNDWAGTTARDFCRRTAAYCATAPLLAERFPDNDHPWRQVVEVNRPPATTDTMPVKVRKRLKAGAVALRADRWLPVLADRVTLPPRSQDVLYRASVSIASYAGYQAGLRRWAEAGAVREEPARPAAGEDRLGLSVVMVTFNCGEEAERAIESLLDHPPSVSYEVVVADNASSDGTVERLRDRLPNVKVIALDENVGYGAAVNIAAKETEGRHLLLLNPDTEVTDGAIDTLLRHAAASPRAGVLGPRLVLGTGLPQPSARRLPSPWRLWLEVLRLHLLLPRTVRRRLLAGPYSDQDEPGPVDWVSGACHLVPRGVWEQVGGLTERTFCGFDDLDYCWRARDAGFETLFCPDAVVVHHCGVSVSRRWTARQIDTIAIHNIYVILQDHWSRARVKVYGIAELAGTISDLVLGPRRSGLRGEEARTYRAAALERLRLLSQLLLDRVHPIERHEPDRPTIGADPTDPSPAVADMPWAHRLAWWVAESGMRGNSRLAGVLRRRAGLATGLVRLPNGQVLHHDPADYVAHSIYCGGYEPAERWAFRRLVRPGGVVVDVGANLGVHTLAASRLVGPGGRVIAIEPGPALAGLRAAVGAAGATNVTIVPCAVGRDECEAVLRVPAHQPGLASLRSSSDDVDPHIVGVRRLDALDGVPPGDIDLLKVDTEGYEAEVLAGATGWLREGRLRAILVEVSPEFGDVAFVGTTARDYGFTIFKVGYRRGLRYRPTLVPVAPDHVADQQTQANYLLLRSDLRPELLC